MGHRIQAIIAARPTLDVLRQRFPGAQLALLRQDFGLVPMTGRLLESLDPDLDVDDEVAGFVGLTRPVITVLEELSQLSPVAYIETDYFGGVGTQSVALFTSGVMKSSMAEADQGSPISDALRELGVQRGSHVDEFAAVGLMEYRTMEGWEEP